MICRGVVDQQEWEAARHAAHTQILVREQRAAQRPPANLLSKPWDGRRFQLWAAACLLVFVLGAGIAGFLITTRLSAPPAVQPAVNPAP